MRAAKRYGRPGGGSADHDLSSTRGPGGDHQWPGALAEFGTMSLADVMADAITLAERGFPMHHFMAGNLKEDAEQMRQWASSAAIFLPGGRPPEPGEVFVQRSWMHYAPLSRSRSECPNRGRAAGSRQRTMPFTGAILRARLPLLCLSGGLLTYDDLASCHAQIEAPVRIASMSTISTPAVRGARDRRWRRSCRSWRDMTCRPSGITPRPMYTC